MNVVYVVGDDIFQKEIYGKLVFDSFIYGIVE